MEFGKGKSNPVCGRSIKVERMESVSALALCFKSRPVNLSFVSVTSQGENREPSGLLTDAPCNLHISVGVAPANQSAAYAYHLHPAAVAPLSEHGDRKREQERLKHKSLFCLTPPNIHAQIPIA